MTDRKELTDRERAAWDSVATAWRDWFPTFEAGAQPLNDHLVDLAGVAPGHQVLDVATGIGEPAVTAARRVGPDGRVIACDLSPGMLAIGRDRAADLGIDNVEFREQDATELSAEGEGFDAAVCRWGLMLMLDPSAAARSIHALLRPGAKLAAAVWGEPSQVPFIATGGKVLRRELDLPPGDPDAPGPFRIPSQEQLRELLEGAGFGDVTTEEFRVSVEFASAERFGVFVSEVSSSARSVLLSVDYARRTELIAAIADEVRPMADDRGVVRMENVALVGVGVA